jgi:uncharacterized protein YPO0396
MQVKIQIVCGIRCQLIFRGVWSNRGNKYEPKDTWWWNYDVQKTIHEKKECYKRLHHHKSDENIQKYKETRRNAKKTVSDVRGQKKYTDCVPKEKDENKMHTTDLHYVSLF